MIWSFRTNGNYVDFVHTEETSLQDEEIVFHLHNTSRCISWSLPEDTTRISFTIDEVKYSDILITDIDFDGTVMNSQDDFETGITAVFTGIGSGGSSYLVYTALLDQTGTDAPVANVLQNTIGAITWSRSALGEYEATSAGLFTQDKTVMPPFTADYIGNSLPYIPVTDQNAITGYYAIERANENVIIIDFRDASINLAEWSSIMGGTPIFIEIRVYP